MSLSVKERSILYQNNAAKWAALLLQLAIAADGHAPTLAGILGVGCVAVRERLLRRRLRAQWLRARASLRIELARAWTSRQNWRTKLKALGINPHTLPVTDPLWPYCHARSRGALLRDVAHELRAEIHAAGEPPSRAELATTARLDALLTRVLDRAQLDEPARRAAHRAACAAHGAAPLI